jgi:deoxyribodipyrimidine photo-lyase
MSTCLYWFTLDLRLEDLPGLAAAAREHEVVPVFILDPADPWVFGGASRWWLHHSLTQLQDTIAQQGGRLILRQGNTLEVLQKLIADTDASLIHFSRAYEPWLAERQQALFRAGLSCKRFAGRLLLEPDTVFNQQGKPFQVFTPYYKHCQRLLHLPGNPPLLTPRWHQGVLKSDRLQSWSLLPRKPDWASGFDDWIPGEEGAHMRLKEALQDRVSNYAERRDYPADEGTSRLSPHLHFGEISPRQVWQSVRQNKKLSGGLAEPFLRQLIWREFSVYLLHHWPKLPAEPFRKQFRHFPWRKDATGLLAWQKGQTGYPIVDAGMRQLWHTGWMHNRVRMIVASFLTKHLRIHWQEGARWFWDTLVDADLANNSAGWQWVAGCGADAAPYFRIFNPVLQGEKFDREGDYIRQWLPELARLPSAWIHQPWKAPQAVLTEAGVTLGKTYPHPVVVHETARAAALDAYKCVKQAASS